jgi:hypothetical protein
MESRRGVLGVIGTSPKGLRGPAAFGRFDAFQAAAGDFETSAGFLAGHAVCHALMNGITRVVFCGTADLADPEAVRDALRRLIGTGEPEVVVAPGLGTPVVESLVPVFERASQGFEPRPVLWLDGPDRADVVGIQAFRDRLGGDPDVVRVVVPHVPTISPGRRSAERLPPTCLIAPLFLGTAPFLKGVHEIDSVLGPDDREILRACGCGLLETAGPRRLVRLAFPAPRVPEEAADGPAPEDDPEARVRRAVASAIEPLIDGAVNGPALWRSIERVARGVLDGFKRQGIVEAFVARCDADTNEGSPSAPVLEVVVRLPKRVREVVIRVERVDR